MGYKEEEIKRLLDAYLQGTATPEEQRLLDQFFLDHKKEVDREELREEDFVLLDRQIRANIGSALTPRANQFIFLKIAAAISVLVIVALIAFYTGPSGQTPRVRELAIITKANLKGQKSTIVLPDGSVVRLNANSKISFPEKFSPDIRAVSLQGEAYFEVTHDRSKPFVVTTGEATTTVLGTSFNIKGQNEKNIVITLVTGKIKVSTEKEALLLKPNQQAVVGKSSARIDTSSVDVTRFIEWKDNILAFDQTPLVEAIEMLEDWYGVEIELKNQALGSCRITGRYEAESLENVMKSLQFILKGEYVFDGQKVTLSGKGCRY